MGKVTLHVVPRARETAIVGPHGDAIKIRVAAPPADGAANAELVRFLAKRLGIPAARIAIASGAQGRRKTVVVQGIPAPEIERALRTV